MASVTIYLQCCCLPTTNKNNNNNRTKQNKHTHTRDPRRNLTSYDRSQHENKAQLFQLIRTFVKKVGVWKEKRKWNNITHATHLKFKASEVQFTVTAQQIQNVLNENLSQSGSGLAKIGTEWGSGERRSRAEQLSQFYHRIDRRPPFNVWSILKISEVWYVLFESISWHEGAICLQSWHQIPRKIFRLLKTQIPSEFLPRFSSYAMTT